MYKNVHIIGGGTVFHIRPHLALSAPAYGSTARHIHQLFIDLQSDSLYRPHLWLTRMAGGVASYPIETNNDVFELSKKIKADPSTKIVFMPVALCDYEPVSMEHLSSFPAKNGREELFWQEISGLIGKDQFRLRTDRYKQIRVDLIPAPKIISSIRDGRKDIFVVGFKTTWNYAEDEMFQAGLNLLKTAGINLVLVNDVHRKMNMIVTPEQAAYCVTDNRRHVLQELVEMACYRAKGEFTRSHVINGPLVPWNSSEIPISLRDVVDHCRKAGAYKPFKASNGNITTVGHFAYKVKENEFLTSIRKSDFNSPEMALVRVVTNGTHEVIAQGAKPSVGGQSQRIIFSEHPEYDCIIHFHCVKKEHSKVPTVSQFENECGSHQCGKNTSTGLMKFGDLSAVMLHKHGPNIVFNSKIDPKVVIDFIESNFDLTQATR